jgi:hypothetical protein
VNGLEDGKLLQLARALPEMSHEFIYLCYL